MAITGDCDDADIDLAVGHREGISKHAARGVNVPLLRQPVVIVRDQHALDSKISYRAGIRPSVVQQQLQLVYAVCNRNGDVIGKACAVVSRRTQYLFQRIIIGGIADNGTGLAILPRVNVVCCSVCYAISRCTCWCCQKSYSANNLIRRIAKVDRFDYLLQVGLVMHSDRRITAGNKGVMRILLTRRQRVAAAVQAAAENSR